MYQFIFYFFYFVLLLLLLFFLILYLYFLIFITRCINPLLISVNQACLFYIFTLILLIVDQLSSFIIFNWIDISIIIIFWSFWMILRRNSDITLLSIDYYMFKLFRKNFLIRSLVFYLWKHHKLIFFCTCLFKCIIYFRFSSISSAITCWWFRQFLIQSL
jgi:hypothetical protein